jgi:hypothetical protein|tara:strand:+ start:1828 stop:2229 length:402 start_codon:yes stop_codon:yes gene_type:complete
MMSANNEALKYICLKRELADWVDSLKDEGILNHAQDLIRTGIILGLTCDVSVVDTKQKEIINRQQGDKNYNSGDIDEDGYISLLIRRFSGDQTDKNYRRMQALANVGIELIRDEFFDEVIKWDEIEKTIKGNT